MTRRTLTASLIAVLLAAHAPAFAQVQTGGPLRPLQWEVAGASRTAFVHRPVRMEGAPVVFAWHGHGGRARYFAAACAFERLWPEAVVVYPQGLATKGRVSDPEGKEAGWQFEVGQEDDRDLKFFDAMLATFGESGADAKRVYSTGHSNGGRFSYLLWAARPDRVAAVAPCASQALERVERLEPKPCLHIAGEGDAIAPYEGQRAGMDRAKRDNACEAKGRPWGPGGVATRFPSKLGAPFVEYVHPGGHEFPKVAPELIVRFFQEVGGE
ncbi:alpha/beta hydrolase family esterase [Paludisphaera soli]|uniref:alpha/beta hydrolase family esterase n=1 Tax=Paludisphaera soli TaxID=2712865 RepID=UPI00197EFE30|nr:hypothetical protein [Paludisphaera soli]